MRLNFTNRRKIDKQHAGVVFRDDPAGSDRGHYFELTLEGLAEEYKLPAEARVFVEATRGLTLMRFDLGTVAAPAVLAPADRRLADFAPHPDGVKFRVKITQPDGPEAGKLLAEADGIKPDDGGVSPLIRIAAGDLGPTPWRLELVPTDPDLPTLWINKDLSGGKEYARDPVAKPLLLTAVAREVFAALVQEGDHEDEPDHWANLWHRFATQVLSLGELPDPDGDEVRAWIDSAVDAFSAKHELVLGLKTHMANLELQDLEEIN